jgi:DNA-binding MarR family transcriptional regulator
VNLQWDLLLELYLCEQNGQRIDVSGLCEAMPVPTTTALRRINLLDRLGVVERVPDRFDGRRVFVCLPAATGARIEACLAEIASTYRMAP